MLDDAAERLNAAQRAWVALDDAIERTLEWALRQPTEQLTAHHIETSVDDDRGKYRLIFRLIDEGNELIPFKYSKRSSDWDSAFHFICSYGRRRLMRAVLKKRANEPDILRIPLGKDGLNAVETMMRYVFTEDFPEDYDGDEELIHYKISTHIAILLQSGKTTAAELIRASKKYCTIDVRVARVIRAWNTRLAAIWCCMRASGAHAGIENIAGLLGQILQRNWAFGGKKKQRIYKRKNC
jgi:hypothetical protein